MKNRFFIGIVCSLLVGLSSCNEEETQTAGTDIAQVTSFSFRKDTGNMGLEKAQFVIQELSDTGLIEVRDSLPYGTRLDSVMPLMTFYYAPYASVIYTPFDTLTYSGSVADTINMSADPMYIRVLSYDKTAEKWYKLKVYAHAVDPLLFRWELLTAQIAPAVPAEQKTLLLREQMLSFANNGFATTLYSSSDGVVWDKHTVEGLPVDCHVERIVVKGDCLYYSDSTAMYTSTNGEQWTQNAYSGTDYRVMSALMAFHNHIWVLAERKEGGLCLLLWENGLLTQPALPLAGDTLAVTFPISDFAVVEMSDNGSEQVLIAGGYNKYGQMVNCHWTIEYNSNEANYRIADYAREYSGESAFAGAAIAEYDNQLYRIGGVNAEQQFLSDVSVSVDQGLHWSAVDSSQFSLPDGYSARRNASVLVKDKNLYIIGGHSQTTTLTDVYKGRINSIDFLRK